MNISNFEDLVQAARLQPTPQRLLLVFTRAELPDDATPQQRASFEAGEGGALVPVMCVDKAAHALASFQALASEATEVGLQWDMLFAAAMNDGGSGSAAEAAVDQALERMVESIKQGSFGYFIPFDRQGQAVSIG